MLKRLSIRSFTSTIFPIVNGNQESSNQDSASNRSSSSSSIHRPIITPDYEHQKYDQKPEHLPNGVHRGGDLPPASLPPILPISTNMKPPTKRNNEKPDKKLSDKDNKKPVVEKKEKKKRKCGILLILLLILLIILLLLLIILLVIFGVG